MILCDQPELIAKLQGDIFRPNSKSPIAQITTEIHLLNNDKCDCTLNTHLYSTLSISFNIISISVQYQFIRYLCI